MKKFKIIVAYDGSSYHGWQIQPQDRTIAFQLQATFERVFGQPISVLGTSRTDAGVHALGQVARFHADLSVDTAVLKEAWNKALPQDIVVRELDSVSDEFHPCHNVYEKTYLYTLFTRRPLPIVARFGWYPHFIDRINFEKLNKILPLFLGEHDFASFCKFEEGKSTIRSIHHMQMNRYNRWGAVQIVVKGPSFLRFQIRRMIGYALDVAQRDNLPISYIQDLLNNPNHEQKLVKAEASGLCLRKVVYRYDRAE